MTMCQKKAMISINIYPNMHSINCVSNIYGRKEIKKLEKKNIRKERKEKEKFSEEQILYYKELYKILQITNMNNFFELGTEDNVHEPDFWKETLQYVYANDGEDPSKPATRRFTTAPRDNNRQLGKEKHNELGNRPQDIICKPDNKTRGG